MSRTPLGCRTVTVWSGIVTSQLRMWRRQSSPRARARIPRRSPWF